MMYSRSVILGGTGDRESHLYIQSDRIRSESLDTLLLGRSKICNPAVSSQISKHSISLVHSNSDPGGLLVPFFGMMHGPSKIENRDKHANSNELEVSL